MILNKGANVGETSKVKCKACGACSKNFFISTKYAADAMAAEAWNRRATMNDLISRDYVLAEYDRQHNGPPGGARKIMEQAPAVDAIPEEG